ncbi:contactin-associated protein-like 3 [Montipora capricornis]|uniref:contactin-associated protein-like 3 n=1 Tax=Montipora capricornis TaxID=246305 RepID=UPI0035F20473
MSKAQLNRLLKFEQMYERPVSARSTEEVRNCRAPVEDRSYWRIRRFRTLCWPSVSGRYVTLDPENDELYEVEVYSAQRGCQIQEISLFVRGRALDVMFSASSSRVDNGPEQCRLYGNGAWLPSTQTNVSDFLQINLGYEFYICATATQGNPTADQWTTKYKIYTSLDNINWTTYKENGTEKVFRGNTGRNNIVKHNLEEVVIASFLRFQPTDFFGHKALRVELYGTLKSPGRFFQEKPARSRKPSKDRPPMEKPRILTKEKPGPLTSNNFQCNSFNKILRTNIIVR